MGIGFIAFMGTLVRLGRWRNSSRTDVVDNAALGSNYRGTMGLHPNHTLVTHGPYRFVRHPINAVFPLGSIVLFLMSANWVLGAGALILIGTISIVRAPIEERQLIERFGEEYRAYIRRTGRFFPRVRRRGEASRPGNLR
jgi:protein-S-isoprenylcysteine O-methyltransferase Ste14